MSILSVALSMTLVLFGLTPRLHAQETPLPAQGTEPSVPAVTPVEPAEVPPAGGDAVPADADQPPTAAPEPVPTEAAAASGDGGGDLSPEELAAMGFGTVEAGAPPVDTSLKISGFIDVTYSGQKSPDNSLYRGIFNRHGSFWVGSVNMYVSKNITDSIRTMFEVRFSYLPNGTPNLGSSAGDSWNTSSGDYNDAGRAQRWGGIVMQRAYLEWSLHEAATLRVGQYLTPYGIWNVDHGSPTIISVMRPFIVGAQLFPERQTGLQLFGRLPFAANHTFEYALTLSNGFGPISEYRDLDNNMAFGGHVAWTCDAFGELTLGGSWLVAKDTSAVEQISISPDMQVGYNEKITQQSDVLSLAADLRWKYEGLLLQSELITQQRRFTDSGRMGAVNPAAGGQYIAPKDATSWGVYGLIGYRFNWLGVMPYFMATYNQIYDLSLLSFNGANALIGGLNFRPIDSVVLKLEYITVKLGDPNPPTHARLHILQAQLAWAF